MAMSISKGLLLTEGSSFEKTRKNIKSSPKRKGLKNRYCQKTRYRYHNSAVQALTKAKHQRQRAIAEGVTNLRTETRIYWHEQCNSYHLTSQPFYGDQAATYAA
jgi:hypothetical protein